jgi:hypothetical protein
MALDHPLVDPGTPGTDSSPELSSAEGNHPVPIGRIVGRGLVAAHGVLIGAVFLFLLHAPSQVLSAVLQILQQRLRSSSGQELDPTLSLLILALSFGALLLALAVLGIYPLVQGGILGQVRDRLESPNQPPGPFGPYGRTFYVRLLGSEGLYVLALLGVMFPVMILGAALMMNSTLAALAADGGASQQAFDPQQFNRQLMTHPAMLTGMLIVSFLASALGMVYWVANCIVVSERERVLASWGKAFRFCWQNCSAVVSLWLVTTVGGIVVSPLGLVGPLGIVTEPWALVALALLYSALIGYAGILLSGVIMSLYLARRVPSGERARELPAAA